MPRHDGPHGKTAARRNVTASAATSAVPPAGSLQRRAFSLGIARGLDYGVQLLLPIVLVRYLDTAEFGQYRLLWLLAGTTAAFATLAMPSSLFYFLPRSDGATQRLYVNQTLLFLTGAGLVAACVVAPWNPWLPESMDVLAQYGVLVPAFLSLWIVAALLDALPTADERVRWQARTTVALAVLRATAMAGTAIVTREFAPLLWMLVAFGVVKIVVLVVYIAGHHGLRGPVIRWHMFSDQIRFAAPFGTGGALYMLRVQADQWIAATLFAVGTFAAFSIAAVLGPLLNVFRQAVSTVFLPSMSRLQASGDIVSALQLNNRANVLVGTLVYPLLGFAFVFAEDLITIVYTTTYIEAAPVMRVYVVGLVALVIELATVTHVLRQGPFMLSLNALTLAVSVVVSWYAAHAFGLAGAAAGSVSVAYVDRVATLWRISKLTGISLRNLQHWRHLALLLALTVLASAVAWTVQKAWLDPYGPLLRVGLGGTVFAATYVTLLAPFATELRAEQHSSEER